MFHPMIACIRLICLVYHYAWEAWSVARWSLCGLADLFMKLNTLQLHHLQRNCFPHCWNGLLGKKCERNYRSLSVRCSCKRILSVRSLMNCALLWDLSKA